MQQGAFEQAGVSFGAQQPPADGTPHPTPHTPQFACASAAQTASHCTEQQKGSAPQMTWQHAWSEQPGLAWAMQQLAGFVPHWAWARGIDATVVSSAAAVISAVRRYMAGSEAGTTRGRHADDTGATAPRGIERRDAKL